MKIGPWTVKRNETSYRNAWIEVEHHEVERPDGKDGVYGVVRFQNIAIGILPLFSDGSVPLVGQHRFPFNAYSWELPEGGGPVGEAPAKTARRELQEETGISANHMVEFGSCNLSNSVTDEQARYFLAWDLIEGAASPDPDEVLAHRRIQFGVLLDRCLDGTITDSLTILMIQTAILKARTGGLPKVPSDIILKSVAPQR